MTPENQAESHHGQFYDPEKSKKGKKFNDQTFYVTLAGGQFAANGAVMKDDVSIGTLTIDKMPFGVAQTVIWGQAKSLYWDGILGLGLPSQNTIKPKPQCTFASCQDGDKIFTTNFKYDNSSSSFMTFGYVDPAAKVDAGTHIPINGNPAGDAAGKWVADRVSFGSGGKIFSKAPGPLQFTTGGGWITAPFDVVDEYFKQVHGANNTGSGWTHPCTEKLPGFDFIFEDSAGPKTVTISGDELLVRPKEGDELCYSSLKGTTLSSAGGPFFASKYVVWDLKTPSLTIADPL